MLSDGVALQYSTDTLATDVNAESVVAALSGTELVRARFVDASSRGSSQPEEYFITVSPSGCMLAGVRGTRAQSSVALIRSTGELPLASSIGSYGTSASFSPDESLIAVAQSNDVIGFWKTHTGELVTRFKVPIALTGADVTGTTGIPPEILRFANIYPDGWPLTEET